MTLDLFDEGKVGESSPVAVILSSCWLLEGSFRTSERSSSCADEADGIIRKCESHVHNRPGKTIFDVGLL